MTPAAAKKPPPQLQTDFRVVDAPALFPSACVLCTGTKGPLIDTGRENRLGRIYVCGRCVALTARVLGLIEGERHTDLLNAGDRIGELEKDVALRDRQIQDHLDATAGYKNQLEATSTLLEAARGREEAMRHQLQMIEEQARQGRQTA